MCLNSKKCLKLVDIMKVIYYFSIESNKNNMSSYKTSLKIENACKEFYDNEELSDKMRGVPRSGNGIDAAVDFLKVLGEKHGVKYSTLFKITQLNNKMNLKRYKND